jgi:CubicO group peptidase (beta-lactamase class C family)
MKPFAIRALLPLLLLCASAPAVRADPVDDYIQAQMKEKQIPGLSLAVVRDGNVLFARGYGMANVELRTPATADTVYEIGSMTKQFTAAAVMKLVERGVLSLEERIEHYLPDLPSAWQEITVRQLLTHTSGIPTYTRAPGAAKHFRDDYTSKEIIALVASRPLQFRPGESWAYSNTGYFLLGMIVEKLSGMPYATFLEKEIFSPLGMTATRVNNPGAIIPNRASGYTLTNDVLANATGMSVTWLLAAGGLISTVQDLAKWDASLYTDRILKPESLREIWTPVRLAGGKTYGYGFGWCITASGGHRLIFHGGRVEGFCGNITRFTNERLTVILLTNMDRFNPTPIAAHIGALILGTAESVARRAEPDRRQPVRRPSARPAAGRDR